MKNAKSQYEHHEAIRKAIFNGDACQLEELFIAHKDDPFVAQWDESLKARIKAPVTPYEKACTIIAFEHHFNNWDNYETFKTALNKENSAVFLFEKAADAVVAGDIPTLNKLLQQHRDLIYARSARNHHGTLLIYTGANGVEGFRQRTPPNAVEVAETLLNAGADVDAVGDMYRGATTLGLVATSVHPVKAGVQKELVSILLKHGADINHTVASDYTEGSIILACLHNGRSEIVSYLAENGANLNLESAAAVGYLDKVKTYFNEEGSLKDKGNAAKRDMGCIWACNCGHRPVVEFFLENNFNVSTIASGMTALHGAVLGGHVDILELLFRHHAPLEIKNSYGGTALGLALWCAYNHPKPQYPQIIEMLISAGAVIEPGWRKYIDEIKSGRASG